MLFTSAFLEGLVDGRYTLAFRRWPKARVHPGGQMRTMVGVLEVEAVERVSERAISEADAARAGFASKAALIEALSADGRRAGRRAGAGGRSSGAASASRGATSETAREEGEIYRVVLRLAGPDPRVALREQTPSPQELDDVRQRLARLDAAATRAQREPWTMRVLVLIASQPEGTRAADLATHLAMETLPFKLLVRKLKEFGLTESLGTGYRLSPRGRALLAHLRAYPDAPPRPPRG